MIAIFKREFRSYFQNVIGWLYVAVILAVFGLYFYVYNMMQGYPVVSYSLSSITFILIIACPILTMRSFSEDRKNKTDQLTLTAPITVGQLVVGKYLSLVAVYSIDMLLVCLAPLIMSAFGDIPMAQNYVAIFGFWLFGVTCLGVGMFISSLTESMVISAVLSFAALFLSYMMNAICGLISTNGNWLTAILLKFDIYTPYSEFINGCLDLTSLCYYVTVNALLCFLTTQSIQKRRWSMSVKKLSVGAFSVVTIVVAAAVAVVANMAVASLPETITSIDCSSDKMYSITSDTKEFLKNLDEDVTLYVLASESNSDGQLDETLSRYESLSGHVSVEYINIYSNPNFYQEYTDSAPTSNSVIVVSDKRSRVVDYNDIYVYDYSMDYTTYSYSSELTGYDAEGQLTSAIEYVTADSESLPVIYTITGHDEADLGENFTEALEKANITLESFELMQEDAVPEDAMAVIIDSPQKDFNENDAQKIADYLAAGGKVLIAYNYGYSDFPILNAVLEEYGITVLQGVAAENNTQYYYGGQQTQLLPKVVSGDYTSSVSGDYIFAPYSVAFTYEEAEDSTLSYVTLLQTTDSGVMKTNLNTATTYEYEEGDVEGPLAIAMAAEDSESGAQLVLYGTGYLLNDSADSVVSGNNSALFTDTISAMVGDVELSTSVIPVKSYSTTYITVDTKKAFLIGIGTMIVLPILMLAAGLVIWLRRRKK